MSVGSNDLLSLFAVAAESTDLVKKLSISCCLASDLLVVLNCSLLFFVSFFSSFFQPRMQLRFLKRSKTDSMRLKSTRPGFGAKFFGFLRIDRCFFLFLFLRRALT